jgi:hypothetical protein
VSSGVPGPRTRLRLTKVALVVLLCLHLTEADMSLVASGHQLITTRQPKTAAWLARSTGVALALYQM